MLRFLYLTYKLFLFFARPLTLGVRVMMIRNGKVLLVRQSYMKGWFMPGGGVKRRETFEQAARREAREEVGADLKRLSLLGAYSNFTEWKSDHNIVFLSQDFKLIGSHDYEVAELRFFFSQSAALGALARSPAPVGRISGLSETSAISRTAAGKSGRVSPLRRMVA